MHASERRRSILRSVAGRGFVSVAELTELLGASEPTVRRDLVALAGEKRVRRVHGGVEAIDVAQRVLVGQPEFAGARTVRSVEKRAIAKRAVELCEPGDAIIIDGGTTTFMMTEFLQDSEIHVLTPSFPVAEVLLRTTRCEVIVPGGPVYRNQQLILSPYDEPSVQNYCARLMFMGAQGIGEAGLIQSDPLLVQAEKQLMQRAEKLVVLVDSSKFLGRGRLVFCPLDQIDTIITDSGITPPTRAMLEGAGVELIVVPLGRSRRSTA
jgi:DeoR family ulaG and ulaABCDEF operon transcriptional repressor